MVYPKIAARVLNALIPSGNCREITIQAKRYPRWRRCSRTHSLFKGQCLLLAEVTL